FTRVGRKDIMDVEGTTGCLDGDPCVAVYVGFDELRPPVTITGEPEMPSLVVGPFLPHVAVYVGFVQVKPYVAAHLLSLLLLSVMVSAEPGGIQRLSQAVSRCRHLCGPPALGRAHVGDPREGADQTIVRASKPMTHIGTPSAPRSSHSAHGMWAITLPPTFYCPTDRRPSLPAMRYSAGLHFHHANNSTGAFPDCGGSCGYELKGWVARAAKAPGGTARGAGLEKEGTRSRSSERVVSAKNTTGRGFSS